MLGPVLKTAFLSTALTFMIVYVWARRNPQVMMNFLGVFNFTAPFMPWVLLGFSFLLSGQLPVADLIGIGAGHAYYYLADVYPLLYGSHPLRTPGVLSMLLNPRDPAVQVPALEEATAGAAPPSDGGEHEELHAAVAASDTNEPENLESLADDEASTSRPSSIRRRLHSHSDKEEGEPLMTHSNDSKEE